MATPEKRIEELGLTDFLTVWYGAVTRLSKDQSDGQLEGSLVILQIELSRRFRRAAAKDNYSDVRKMNEAINFARRLLGPAYDKKIKSAAKERATATEGVG